MTHIPGSPAHTPVPGASPTAKVLSHVIDSNGDPWAKTPWLAPSVVAAAMTGLPTRAIPLPSVDEDGPALKGDLATTLG